MTSSVRCTFFRHAPLFIFLPLALKIDYLVQKKKHEKGSALIVSAHFSPKRNKPGTYRRINVGAFPRPDSLDSTPEAFQQGETGDGVGGGRVIKLRGFALWVFRESTASSVVRF